MIIKRQTDIDLVRSCQRQDRLAQKELYDRYKNAMYTLIYRITNDFALSEEVLQDAFVKVFKHIGNFRGEASIGSWIKTIVTRTALEKVRNKIVFEPFDNTLREEVIDWGHHLDADYLERAIQNLSEGYRSVFVLIEIEGYSHKEVATLLGISVGTSKSQLYHAKRKLKSQLLDLKKFLNE